MKFQLLSLNVGRCWNAILLFNGWTFQFGSHSNLCQSALRSDLHSTTHVPASMTERVFHSFKLHLVPFRVLELLAFSLTLNLFLQKEVLQLSRDTSEVCVLRRSVVVILKFQRNVLKLLFYDRFWSPDRIGDYFAVVFEYSGIAWYSHARFWKLLSPFFALTPLLPGRKVIFKYFDIRMNLSAWESRLKVLEIIILQQLLLQICTIHAKQAFFFWSAFCLSASFAAFLVNDMVHGNTPYGICTSEFDRDEHVLSFALLAVVFGHKLQLWCLKTHKVLPGWARFKGNPMNSNYIISEVLMHFATGTTPPTSLLCHVCLDSILLLQMLGSLFTSF